MKHGTAGGYRFYRCTCKACRAASRADINARRYERRLRRVLIDGRLTAPLPPRYHGKRGTYGEWACRCVACTQANRDDQRDYMARKRAQQEGNP